MDCDRRTHDEEGLRDHVRVPLDSVVTALTVCQKCDQVPASVRLYRGATHPIYGQLFFGPKESSPLFSLSRSLFDLLAFSPALLHF